MYQQFGSGWESIAKDQTICGGRPTSDTSIAETIAAVEQQLLRDQIDTTHNLGNDRTTWSLKKAIVVHHHIFHEK